MVYLVAMAVLALFAVAVLALFAMAVLALFAMDSFSYYLYQPFDAPNLLMHCLVLVALVS